MKKLTHTDQDGKAIMIDIGDKEIQKRVAKAAGKINIQKTTVKAISDNLIKKGDVLTVSQIAGINAAKETAKLIPLCHNIVLDKVSVSLTLKADSVEARSEVKCTGRTGAEMEALTAVSISLLTVYDMCKAIDNTMVIGEVKLLEKIKK